ncbi:MAG: ferritin family protein [Dehalococcoidia bacterium]|nr:MAG: ferritin family protein [Dehalococcoidia bacterium]
MKAFGSADEILDFAIGKEEEAAQLYTRLGRQTEKSWMRQVFEEFANEERGHKAKLEAVKEGKLLLPAAEKVMDLKIADYVVDVEPSPDLDYQDALIVAMKAEKAAFKLYNDLAAATDDEALRATLLALAQEEAKHKLRFEIEYDEHILAAN